MTSEARKYHILSVLGEGGFGRVYRARMEVGGDFSKEVAIKVLRDADPDEDLLTRFRDEARILALVRDRALVSVDPPVRLGSRWAVVMDLVDGESCHSLMKRHGKLPVGVAMEIIEELARVLNKAYHFKGPDGGKLELLHRDIKPANVLITPTGEVRLLDFGSSRASFSARESVTTDIINGTPGFIAPERFSGFEGPEQDVFGLGILLWIFLTGESAADRTPIDLRPEVSEVEPEEGERQACLYLAATMRHPDHRTRPTAREVERTCRQMRFRLPQPFLREWSETHVKPPVSTQRIDRAVALELSESIDLQDFDSIEDTEIAPADATTAITIPEPVPPDQQTTVRFIRALFLGSAFLIFASMILGAALIWRALTPDPIVIRPEAAVAAPPVPVAPDGGLMAPIRSEEAAEDEEDVAAPPIRATGRAIRPPAAPVTESTDPPPQPVAQPTVSFRSVPWGATIRINGIARGKTPAVDMAIPKGDHTVKLELGDASIERFIRVGERSPNDYSWKVETDQWVAGFAEDR